MTSSLVGHARDDHLEGHGAVTGDADHRGWAVAIFFRPPPLEQEDQQRVAVFANDPTGLALIEYRLINALDGAANGLILKGVCSDIEGPFPCVGEFGVGGFPVVGRPARDPGDLARFQDVPGLGEGREERLLFLAVRSERSATPPTSGFMVAVNMLRILH